MQSLHQLPYPHQLFKHKIVHVITPHCHKSWISYLLNIVNPTMSGAHFQCLLKITKVNIWGIFNATMEGSACFVMAELIHCCM